MKKPSASAHARLTELQHRIYRSLQRDAARIFGPTPSAIRRYERACREDYRGRFQISTKAELIAAIRGTDVALVADYHAFGQAQRTALRLLRESALPGEKWVLGLELIPSQFQKALDDYQAGLLTVGRFHELIRYKEEWGFPWKNYEPLFAWARRHDVQLLALNRPKELIYRDFGRKKPASIERSIQDLHARDEWAAGIITDCFHESAVPLRMLVLYGGYHVGRSHLPSHIERISKAFLGKPLNSVSVHQNVDELYWKLARQERELHAQVLRLRKDAYCVFSGTPWAQLQSLISTSEGDAFLGKGGPSSQDHPDLDDDESDNDSFEEADHLSQMQGYASVIAEFMDLASPSFESLTLHTIEEADFVDSLGDAFSAGEIRLIQSLVKSNHRVYLPRAQVAYIGSPSPNASAELAAIHLLREKTRVESFYDGGRDDFFRLVLEAAFGFLGSLILNPRRKCDQAEDHARRLRALSRGELPAFAGEKGARKLALDIIRGTEKRRERALRDLPTRASPEAFAITLAARFVGQALGKALHPVLLGQDHGDAGFRRVVGLLLRRKHFETAFEELVLPVPEHQYAGPSKADSI